jgi:c-di-GMP-binding flagellar brake protein YcgR
VRVDRQGRRAAVFHEISDLDRRRLVRFIFECQRTERQRGLREENDGN